MGTPEGRRQDAKRARIEKEHRAACSHTHEVDERRISEAKIDDPGAYGVAAPTTCPKCGKKTGSTLLYPEPIDSTLSVYPYESDYTFNLVEIRPSGHFQATAVFKVTGNWFSFQRTYTLTQTP